MPKRLWTPSLTDFFFIAVIFWLFMADPSGWERLVTDGDTALHTRTGDYILDHGSIPTVDPFSFTKPGERWFPFQWLTGVLYALLNRWAGLKGIVLLAGAVIALTSTLLVRNAAGVTALLDASDLSRERYDSGLASYIEILTADQQLFEQQLLLAQTRGAELRARAELYRTLGGGWQP